MAQPLGGWIHSFAVTETNTHKKGYTIYKITSIVFPRSVPEALTCISVWKRFHDVKRLYRDLQKRHRNLSLNGKVPEPKNDYFKRFDPEVIKARKEYILYLLDFAAQHPALYKSQSFLSFFENGYSPNNSPLHKVNKVGNIEKICDKLDLTYEDNISLIDPKKDDSKIENDKVCVKTKLNELTAFENIDKNTEKIEEEKEHADNTGQNLSDKDETTVEISKTPILTPMVSIEEGDVDYIYEAALEFSQAVQAEVNLEYQEAYEKYKKGIEKLLGGSKDEMNEERKFIAKAKVAKYMARSDEIYEKFILHRENEKKLSFQLSIDMCEDSTIETAYLERPWNQLSRFKVMQIIDSVLQVQDVTDKSTYILKGIEKPSYNSKAQSIFLPQGVPYMVELIGYFQSADKIFLLLRQAKGGKLFDYIKMYTPNTVASISLNEIFAEIESDTTQTNISVNEKASKEQSVPEIEFTFPDPDFEQVLDDFQNLSDKDSSHLKMIQDILSEDQKDNNVDNVEANSPHVSNCSESIPFDNLSQDMDINDLVDCSQKLLRSVSKTLDKSKNTETEKIYDNKNEAIQPIDDQIEKYNIKLNEKQTLTVEKGENLIAPCSPRMKIKTKFSVPEVSVKQWARELVVAIDSLHSKGVILGDLHPDNILLGSKGQLLLSYFHQNEGCDPSSNFIYNPLVNETYCIAPERPLTMKSDWWSFGVVLFELITGCSFRSCHPGGIYMYFEVQFPNIDISHDARNLLESVLVPEPEKRLDISSIKAHPFFTGTLWNDLYQKGVNFM
ncbi:ribosomal protein S6 kinase delta-1 [Condylostylus longicornis]|uniref:ribosomal protein S6 kinase delta-1 n=1 Tax=Condylostylus longicornis TaxID=2530218 RepID=UPI00244D9F24|nr:ribosomal protein S6 kinase delta-1 [Condylostylus longicornis]